ncbi:MAG: tyrosine-type recombinase/integrase [Bacteroidota bacterium]
MKSLPLDDLTYRQLLSSYQSWLTAQNYGKQLCYGAPLAVRELLWWLEQQSINSLSQVSKELLESYLTYLFHRKSTRRNGKISSSHLRKHYQALKLFDKYLQSSGEGYLTLPPLQLSEEVKKVTSKIPLTETDIQKLYAVCTKNPMGYRDRLMLDVYYGCGLRRKEGVNLKVSDVLLAPQLLYVRESKNGKDRYVPFNETLQERFSHYIGEVRSELGSKLSDTIATDKLFTNRYGNALSDQSLALRLSHLAQLAQLKKPVSLHLLRHSIATHLLQRGVPLKQIQLFLGHSSLESTQIYTHILEDFRHKTLDIRKNGDEGL